MHDYGRDHVHYRGHDDDRGRDHETIVNSDVIMVMDHGRIIERGDHDSLMEQGGTYYRLYTGGLEID